MCDKLNKGAQAETLQTNEIFTNRWEDCIACIQSEQCLEIFRAELEENIDDLTHHCYLYANTHILHTLTSLTTHVMVFTL